MKHTVNHTDILQKRENLITFLENAQRDSGLFESARSSDPSFKTATTIATTFYTALTLRSLAQSRYDTNQKQEAIIKKASQYLLSQKSQYWTWNYLDTYVGQSPYPDDLDDTFLCAAALHHADPGTIDGGVLAALVKNLVSREVAPGGPYYTWCVSAAADPVWQDVDVVVNTNIAAFLSLHDIQLPVVNEKIEAALNSVTSSYSPYYPTPYSLWYFVSSWYQGNAEALAQRIHEAVDEHGRWGNNPFDTALCVNTLLHLGVDVATLHDSVAYLASCKTNALCRPYVFGVERITEKGEQYSGSSAFTAAVVYQALSQYLQVAEKKDTNAVDQAADAEDVVYARILDAAGIAKKTNSASSVRYAHAITQHPQAKSGCLLGYYAWRACTPQDAYTQHHEVPESVIKYGTAALYGSIAYKIYDDFFDEEGRVDALTLASRSSRELSAIYIGSSQRIRELFLYITEAMDGAQDWEEKMCKVETQEDYFVIPAIPEYGQYSVLAQKSLGLLLAPLSTLLEIGNNPQDTLMQNLIDFYTQYIIARQLNDDGHDWQEDLRVGKLNSVSALLAQKYLEIGQPYHTEETIEYLSKMFWNEDIKQLSHTILAHTTTAADIVAATPGIYNPHCLLKILKPLEDAARRATTQATTITDFLSEYQKEET